VASSAVDSSLGSGGRGVEKLNAGGMQADPPGIFVIGAIAPPDPATAIVTPPATRITKTNDMAAIRVRVMTEVR
jgi:hypothetical protein